jgi:hypothetical protein
MNGNYGNNPNFRSSIKEAEADALRWQGRW